MAGLIALGCLGWVITLDARGREAQQHLQAARSALSGGATAGLLASSPGDVGEARAVLGQLTTACAETAVADGMLRDVSSQIQAASSVVDALDSVPGVGSRTRAQVAALEVGTQLAAAGTALCTGLQPLVGTISPAAENSTSSSDSTRGAFKAVLAARPQLVVAADRLQATLDAIDKVPETDLEGSARDGVVSLRGRLPELIRTLRDTTTLLDVLGGSGDHYFLLVSQNPDELRPTGGYIGSAGVVAVADGSIRLVEYGSSRAYDTPPNLRAQTPSPFNTYLGEYWELAGGNWWASFPDVARQLAYFYNLTRPDRQLDGVVAVDQFALQRLLEVLGPIEVPGYPERIGASDVQTALDRYVHAGDGYDETGRKQFTAALSGAVLQQVLSAPKPLVPSLVRAMRVALDQQHVLVSLWEPTAAVALAQRRWDGALLRADQDSLLVVDTEVVASKQSQAISRDVSYRVYLADAAPPRAQTTITYTNRSVPQQNVTYVPDYRTFVRVYAPRGASLTTAEGFSGPLSETQECDRAVFGGEVLIPPGATVQAEVSYRLPGTVVSGAGYSLVVQQQPGVPPGRLSVTVTGREGVSAVAHGDNTPGQQYHWQLPSAGGSELQALPLPVSTAGGCGTPLVRAEPTAAPAWLEIPAARISAAVVDIGVEPDGGMEAPPSPDLVGWYRMSARAGQPGNSVLAGHVDWGPSTAVFWGLRNLGPADSIDLRGSDGVQHRYVVEWNRVFSRNDASATEFVRGTDDAVLTLITCDGIYDRSVRDYSERRIVRAVLSE